MGLQLGCEGVDVIMDWTTHIYYQNVDQKKAKRTNNNDNDSLLSIIYIIVHCKKEVVVLTSVLVTSVALHDYNLSWYAKDM